MLKWRVQIVFEMEMRFLDENRWKILKRKRKKKQLEIRRGGKYCWNNEVKYWIQIMNT